MRHPSAADARVHHYEVRMIGADFADDRGVPAQRMCPHGGENFVGNIGHNDREFPFVRHVKRIEPENLTRALHVPVDWDPRFVEEPRFTTASVSGNQFGSASTSFEGLCSAMCRRTPSSNVPVFAISW